MTSVSTTTVTDPSSVNIESAGVEDAESSQGGNPAQLEPGNDLTAEEEALLYWVRPYQYRRCTDSSSATIMKAVACRRRTRSRATLCVCQQLCGRACQTPRDKTVPGCWAG